MNIVGTLVMGPHEVWLKKVLPPLKQICDTVVIVQNNTDSQTKKTILKEGFVTYEDNREWGIHQPEIKQTLCEYVGRYKPDWIVTLDADEILEERLTREKLEELASHPNQVSYYLWCVEFWDSEIQHREDFLFEDIRFYKYLPSLGLNFKKTPLHCGMAPEYAYLYGTRSEYYFKHYGLLRKDDRDRKIARYERYDPKAKFMAKNWYEALKSKLPPLKDYYHEELIKILPKTKFKSREPTELMNKKDTKIWRFMNPHGVIITVETLKHYEETVKRQGFQFLGVEDLHTSGPELPVVEKESEPVSAFPADQLQCLQCEYRAKTERGLKVHTTRTHV